MLYEKKLFCFSSKLKIKVIRFLFITDNILLYYKGTIKKIKLLLHNYQLPNF
jgi:hypothetical protein